MLYSYDPITSLPKDNRQRLTEREVSISNYCQVTTSTRFVYSPYNNFENIDKYLQDKPELQNPFRSRVKVSSNNKIEFTQI